MNKPMVVATGFLMAAFSLMAADVKHESNAEVTTLAPIPEGTVYEIEVDQGVTATYSCDITGGGGIRKTGLGTLVLSGANTYQGGFDLNRGKVQVNSATAFGTGTVTVSGNHNDAGGANSPQMFFNVANATYDNPFELTGPDSASHEDSPLFMFDANTTLKGDITSATSQPWVRLASSSSMPDAQKKALVVNFHGQISKPGGGGAWITCRVYGNWHFYGAIKASSFALGVAWSSDGNAHFHNPENNFNYNNIVIRRANLVCEAANVLNNAYLYDRDEATGNVDLNGYDQTVALVYTCFDSTAKVKEKNFRDDQHAITSSRGAPTLTITKPGAQQNCCSILRGPISLCLDMPKDNLQNFFVRQNDMTGGLRVKSGVFGMSSETTFKKLSSIRIDEDGEVRFRDVISQCFIGVTNLEVYGLYKGNWGSAAFQQLKSVVIGPKAKLLMAGGQVIMTERLQVGDQVYTRGAFTSEQIPQLADETTTGATILVVGESRPVAWTGEGTTDGIADPGNWAETVDVEDGSVKAIFSAGTSATIDQNARFGGLVLDAVDGFAFRDAGGKISVGSNGIVASPADGDARTYVFGAPVEAYEQTRDLQVWSVPSNQTVTFEKGFTAQAGVPLMLTGEGTYEWKGTGTLANGMVVSGAVFKVSGKIASPNLAAEGAASDDNAQSIRLYQSSAQSSAKMADSHVLLLDNAVIEKPIVGHNVIGTMVIAAAPATTNVLAGHVLKPRYARGTSEDGWGEFYIPDGSEIVLAGGYSDSYAATRVEGGGTLRIRDKPVKIYNSLSLNPEWGKIVLEVADNDLSFFVLGLGNNNYQNTAAEFLVSGALKNGTFVCGAMYDNNKRCIPATNPKSEVEFHGTTQAVNRFAAFPNATLHGDYPATLRIVGNQNSGSGYLLTGYEYVSANVTGGLGFEMSGTGTLLFKSRAFASCGDLKVTSGTMEFAADASWLNGTNVTVTGTGTLKLDGAGILSRKCVLHLGESGVVSIPSGKTLRVRAAFVDGVEIMTGSYTYDKAPAALKPHLTEGGGSLIVSGNGLGIIVR